MGQYRRTEMKRKADFNEALALTAPAHWWTMIGSEAPKWDNYPK
jgi:hypothetical protein